MIFACGRARAHTRMRPAKASPCESESLVLGNWPLQPQTTGPKIVLKVMLAKGYEKKVYVADIVIIGGACFANLANRGELATYIF